ncbi:MULTISPECIES: GNAT family N-acetyltransferase [Bacteroides]|jgi:putative acetyltransferase|uniref:GNAT family N-acetyltransferase n=1 Tax=Bacteroides TaxID=816 RepID=UPI000E499355|nr:MULTISPECIES: GNAT family N-acetyltransferase [Bacteroides]RHL05237.1 GNAT family N-acetyltransferase [Bacteroides sp. AF39-11AC]
MKIHHIAIWTFRLEELREFYIRYFNGTSNEKYINPKKGFESYFIYFDDGAALELMSRTDVQNTPIEENKLGLTHFALSFQSKEDVLRTTEQLRSDGYTIAGEPRTSGDGYFESVILDPDGNRVECVYRKEETNNEADAPIETERLLLRPFQESDAEAFFKCCQNPNIGNNAGWKPHGSLEESQEILRSVFISQSGIWAIILKEDGRLIGSVGIIPDPKRENPQARMLGYWLDESHWGKGYMTEAVQSVLDYGFNTLQLSLITANCYPHNERSQQVLKRHGFIYEGTLHQAELTYDGHLYDHQCYYLAKP